MNKEEIRDMVRRECADILAEAGLSGDEIVIKSDKVTTDEVQEWGVSSLSPVRRVQGLLVLAAKSGVRVVKIVAVALGTYQAVQFGSELLFQKTLPDANELARDRLHLVPNRPRRSTLTYTSEAEFTEAIAGTGDPAHPTAIIYRDSFSNMIRKSL